MLTQNLAMTNCFPPPLRRGIQGVGFLSYWGFEKAEVSKNLNAILQKLFGYFPFRFAQGQYDKYYCHCERVVMSVAIYDFRDISGFSPSIWQILAIVWILRFRTKPQYDKVWFLWIATICIATLAMTTKILPQILSMTSYFIPCSSIDFSSLIPSTIVGLTRNNLCAFW